MGFALNYQQALEMETCCNCGMAFAAPQDWLANKKRDRTTFYCPAGHSQHYMGETYEAKVARLEREKRDAEASRRFAEQRLELEKQNHQKELKRREKRAHAGVCQHCHRTFENVARHMKTKHSEVKEEAAKAPTEAV